MVAELKFVRLNSCTPHGEQVPLCEYFCYLFLRKTTLILFGPCFRDIACTLMYSRSINRRWLDQVEVPFLLSDVAKLRVIGLFRRWYYCTIARSSDGVGFGRRLVLLTRECFVLINLAQYACRDIGQTTEDSDKSSTKSAHLKSLVWQVLTFRNTDIKRDSKMTETNGINHIDGSKKSLILNAFVEMCSGHQSPGLWRHERDESWKFNDIDHWTELATLLEEAKFHGIFIADVLGGYDVYNGNLDAAIRSGAQWPVNEPLSVVPAMAAVTKSLGFGVTISTTYEQPYHLARRLSTVDHLTKGRLGWNIVTSYLDSAARNMGFTQQLAHDDRYAMAEEYVKVVYKLLESSWRDDAVRLDRTKGVYSSPDLIRPINHTGKFFNVPGPHICQPSPQRTPLLLQAGTSRAGKEFAAQHAEAIFVSAHQPAVCAKNIAEIRQLAREKYGRAPQSIKVLALVTPILGNTTEEAQAKFDEYKQYASHEGALALFGGWTGINLGAYAEDQELRYVESNAVRSTVEGYARFSPATSKWTRQTIAEHISIGGNGPVLVGTPAQVADGLQIWVDEADIDGFNFAYALFPDSFKDIIKLLLPELRRRGLFWSDYAVPGGTYRENFYGQEGLTGPRDDHVASKYRWKASQTSDEHQIPA